MRDFDTLGPIELFVISPLSDEIIYTAANKFYRTRLSAAGKPAQLLPVELGANLEINRLVFSPDGKRLLILRGAKEIVELTLAGPMRPKLVTNLRASDTWYVDYAPDGDGVIVPPEQLSRRLAARARRLPVARVKVEFALPRPHPPISDHADRPSPGFAGRGMNRKVGIVKIANQQSAISNQQSVIGNR